MTGEDSGRREKWKDRQNISINKLRQDFPDGPMVKTPFFQCRGQGFGELRAHMPHSRVKEKEKKKKLMAKGKAIQAGQT